MIWSKEYEKCISCETTKWEHLSSGFCLKCYPLIKKREVIKQWNLHKKETLRAISPISEEIIDHLIKWNELEITQKNLLVQLDERLSLYKRFNTPGKIEASDIEKLFNEGISNLITNSVDLKLPNEIVNEYQSLFDNKQRQIVYKSFLYILISKKFNLDVWKRNYTETCV
jgi:hypothetical protein